jgi:hypothetical protein
LAVNPGVSGSVEAPTNAVPGRILNRKRRGNDYILPTASPPRSALREQLAAADGEHRPGCGGTGFPQSH